MKQHLKLLLVGGTGIISTAVSKLAIEEGHELWLINRGNHNDKLPEGAHIITADINDTETVSQNDKLKRLVPGFRAEDPFRVGIRHSLEYIKAHPECHIEAPIFDSWCDRLVERLTTLAKEISAEFPNYV